MSVSTLNMTFCGVHQSYSTSERTRNYDCGTAPSKSAWTGLVLTAKGIRLASADTSMFRRGRFGVRVDREGVPVCDARTASDVELANGAGAGQVQTWRWMIADAHYTVAFESEDVDLLRRIDMALRSPKDVLFLGRREFVPTLPIWTKNGLRLGENLESALKSHPWRPRPQDAGRTRRIRFVVETKDGSGDLVRDDPVSLDPAAPVYGWRGTKTTWIPTHELTLDASLHEKEGAA